MRILLIAKTLTFHRVGGFETHVTELATELVKRGHEVGVVCRELKNKDKVKTNFKIHDTKYVGLDIDVIDNITSIPFFVGKIRQVIKDYDIVHGHGTSSVAYILSKSKLPFVYTLHGLPEYNLAGYNKILLQFLKIPFDIQKICLLKANKVICQSKKMMREGPKYYKFSRDRCVYIPSSLHVNKFKQKRNDGKNIVGFVGFLHERKGLDILIRSMENVIKKIPNAKLVVVGSGDNTRFLRLSKELSIDRSIKFVNNASDENLINLYNSFDIFVLPSKYESFGLAAYEAVAAGTPIIVSKTADFEELAKGNGFSTAHDNISEISKKITLLLEEGILRKKLSNNCYEKIKPFDWSNTIKKIETLYENLI